MQLFFLENCKKHKKNDIAFISKDVAFEYIDKKIAIELNDENYKKLRTIILDGINAVNSGVEKTIREAIKNRKDEILLNFFKRGCARKKVNNFLEKINLTKKDKEYVLKLLYN